MLCLFMEDVNWFYLLEEGKVVLLNCFVFIEAPLWYDLCSRYFHTYDPPRNVFRTYVNGHATSKLLVSHVFSKY